MVALVVVVTLVGVAAVAAWAVSARPRWVDFRDGSRLDVSTVEGQTFRGQLVRHNRHVMVLAHASLMSADGPGEELAGVLHFPRERVYLIAGDQ